MRKKIEIRSQILVMLVAFGVILGCSSVSFAQTTDELLALAFKSYKKQDYATATTDINTVLKSQPKNAVAFYYLGLIASANEKYDESIADHTKAIEYDPTTPQFYYERANAYIYKPDPDYKAAIADLNRAIELLPAYGDAYDQKGYSYLKLKDWTAAESNFTQAIKYGVNTKEIYINRGAARSNSDNYDQAVADYRKALEIDPNYDVAKTHLADALARQNQPVKSGLSVDALQNRAIASMNAGDFNSALRDMNEAVSLEPRDLNYYLRGEANYLLAKYDVAIVDLSQSIALDPTLKNAYYLRGFSYQKKQPADCQSAINDYSKAFALWEAKPGEDHLYSPAKYDRGICYQELKQWRKAEDDYLALSHVNYRTDAEFYIRFSQVLFNENSIQSAITQAYKAVESEPANAKAIENYKMLFDKMPASERLAEINKLNTEYDLLQATMNRLATDTSGGCNSIIGYIANMESVIFRIENTIALFPEGAVKANWHKLLEGNKESLSDANQKYMKHCK